MKGCQNVVQVHRAYGFRACVIYSESGSYFCLVIICQCIGATTLDEHRKHIEKDKALARRFQPVMVLEPSQVPSILELVCAALFYTFSLQEALAVFFTRIYVAPYT